MQGDIKRKQPPVQTPKPETAETAETAVPATGPVPSKSPARSKRSMTTMKHHFMTLAFLLGFIVDNLTLNRVDQVFDQVLLAFYVLLAMGATVVLYATTAGKLPESINARGRAWSPYLMQYAFGGLLSGMLIFYGRSGAWGESWPFLLIILLAIYGNETINDRATRLIYNIGILFVGLFSYVVLLIPVLTGHMGAWIFVGSGLLALFIMYWFVRLIYAIIPNFMELQMKALVFTLGLIFAGFNFLYFANLIPPIPLSLKDVGIFHSVVHFENGDYQLKYESGKWWQVFKKSDRVFHPTVGGNVFCFAKVYAPTKLNTDIYHQWEYYDETKGKWVEHLRMSYAISGGRSDGYRGYTLIQNYRDGKWRCSVETERGQVLGRETFTVDSATGPAELVTRTD